MNKVYRVIWSTVHKTWVVVSEMSSRGGKRCGSERRSQRGLVSSEGCVQGHGFLHSAISVRLKPLLTRLSGSLAAVLLGLASVDMAEAGSVTTLGGGTYDSATTDYYQYSYRIGGYTPTRGWDNQYALGAYVSIGVYASTKSNKADDAIFKLDGYNGNGRGGGVAVGDSAAVVGETGVALGAHSQALRNFSMALGGNSLANGLGSIATGREANALGNYSIAHGFVATASGTGAIGMGQSSMASGLRSIAIGTSSQLTALGNTAGDGSLLSQATNASGTDAVSIGTGASSAADASLALGNGAATAGGAVRGVALGNSAKVSGASGVAIGDGSQASAANALSVGTGNQVSGAGSVALGNSNQVLGDASAVIGNSNSVTAGQSNVFALGNNILGSLSNSVALGSNSVLSAAAGASTAGMQVAGGTELGGNAYSFAGAAPVGVVSMGADGAERRVQHVAAGLLSAGSTDAVNGSQLFATNQQTTMNSDEIQALGGRMSNAEGSLGEHAGRLDAAEAGVALNSSNLGALDGRVDAAQGDIVQLGDRMTGAETLASVQADQIGSLQQHALQWNAAIDAFDASQGGDAQVISRVAAGNLSADSTDAVNGGQLFSTNQQVADNAAGIGSLDGRVGEVEGGVAGLSGRMASVEGDVADHAGSIGGLQSGVAGLDSRLGSVTGEVAGQALSIGQLQQDALQWSMASQAYDASHGTAQAQKITRVAAGDLNIDSTDAVNGGQLFSTNQQVAQQAASIGSLDGRVGEVEGGVVGLSGRMTSVEGNVAEHAGSIGGLQTGVTTLSDRMGGVEGDVALNTAGIGDLDGRISAVQGDVAGQALSIGQLQQDALQWNMASQAYDASHGTDQAQKITRVAGGDLSIDSTDAVNGGQLFATNEQVLGNTASIAGLDGRVGGVETGLAGLDGRVTSIEGGIAGNAGDISGLADRLNATESSLALQGGSISTLQQDALQWSAAIDAFDASHGTGQAQKVSNVAAGELNVASTDAVNGGQLFATNQQVAGNTAGIAALDVRVGGVETGLAGLDGRVASIEGGIAGNADEISGLDGRISATESNLALQGDSISSLQQDALQWNAATGAYDASHGSGQSQKISNVAAADLSADSTDAVNGGQLFSTNQQVAGNTANIASLDGRVTNVEGDMNQLDGRVSFIEGGISGNADSLVSLDGRVTQVEGDVTGLGERMNSAEGNISGLQGGFASLVDRVGSIFEAGTRYFRSNSTGPDAQAIGQDSIAIGSDAVATHDGSVALGAGSRADGATLGQSAYLIGGSANGEVNVGDRRLTGVAAGAQDTDAVNVGQLKMATANAASAAMTDALVYDSSAHDRITLGGKVYDSVTGKGGSKITNLARGEADSDAVNMAQLNEANVRIDGIDGRVSTIEGSISSINNGGGIKYVRTQSSKADAVASGVDSVAIGSQAQASGNGALAMGDSAVASADGSVAIGRGATDNGRGAESYTGQYSGAANTSAGTVSVGNAGAGETRTVSNVADARESTDAVNLRQLDGAVAESKAYTDSTVKAINSNNAEVSNRVNSVEASVEKVRNGTDGMFQVNSGSERAKPAATGKNSVAGGAGAVASGDNSTAVGQNAKATGKNSVAVGANSVAERDNSVAVGSRGAERQVTHVAAGTQSTDAVNLGQMNQAIANLTNDANAYTDKRYSDLKQDMNKMDDQLSAGIAGAVAIASLPQPVGNGGSTTAVGMGAFNGQAAVSVGVSHISNDGKWSTKAGGSTDTQGTFTLGVGVGYNW